jgi:hypothetical protein
MAKQTIEIDTTKRGFAAMWESGGGMTSGGSATIITGRNGEARRPVYMPRGGHLACGDHALITVHEGFHIIRASVSRGSRESATISRIVSTSVKDIDGVKFEAAAEVEELNRYSRGEWDHPLDAKFEKAVEAAFRKAGSYHCRSACYIDSSEKPQQSEADKQRREDEMKRQEAERARLRQEKAEREAQVKAEAEAASKAAKEAGLGARLEAVNDRLVAVGSAPAEIGDAHFKWAWQVYYFTESSVSSVEQYADQREREAAEKARKRQARGAFEAQFDALQSRLQSVGLTAYYEEDGVRLEQVYYAHVYSWSDPGLAELEVKIASEEQALAEAKAKADAEARYQARKAEAAAQGLPQDVRIWRRTGGSTNAGNGWVIGPDGVEREPTSMENPNPRRLQRYGEGFMVWEQILPGEVVLKWSKECSAAPHEFEVLHVPAEGLTKAQLTHIAMLEEDLDRDWASARGLASGLPSPPVGRGWGLAPAPKPTPAAPATLADLKSKFGKR